MKMLITEAAVLSKNGDVSFEGLKALGELTVAENMSYKELESVIEDYDVLFCNKLSIDKNIIDRAKRLKYIGECATGYNNIDIEYCRKKGITVTNAGEYSTNAVAQQVFAYILAHYSRVAEYDAFVKDGGWIKSPVFSPVITTTDELCGKTLGIIGFGSIGRRVAKIAEALGMNILVHTRTIRDNSANYVSLDELLKNSDIISLHCPLTAENSEMMNADSFAKCKEGAYFINTARGGLVNEQALFDALSSGKLSGAAVDVISAEPMKADCVLVNAPNILITPHSAWVPVSTRKRHVKIVENNLSAYLGGAPQNKIV